MSRKKKKKQGKEMDPNAWMVTFSDLVTLMITFFVLLLTMSNLNVTELKKVFKYFPGATTPMMGGDVSDPKPALMKPPNISSPRPRKKLTEEQHEESFHAVTDWIREQKLLEDITVVRREDAFEIHVDNNLFFDEGSVRLKSEFLPLLKEMSVMLKKLDDVRLRVEVIATEQSELEAQKRYDSLWAIAMKRGSVLAERLKRYDVDKERLSMMGYGEKRPYGKKEGMEQTNGQQIKFIFLENDLPG